MRFSTLGNHTAVFLKTFRSFSIEFLTSPGKAPFICPGNRHSCELSGISTTVIYKCTRL